MTPFRWYLAGLGSWYTGYGMASILFPWLVAVVLHESPQRIGLAQLALMGPAIALLLVGGAAADRADGRALLLRYHLLAVAPPLALAAAVAGGAASYAVILVYGVAVGTLSAFILPARDALLSRIAAHGLTRAVPLATASQFIFQLVGIALAGTAARVGAVALLVAQALAFGAGAVAAWRLPRTPAPPVAAANRLAAIRDGLRMVAHSERIYPVIVTMAAVGILFVGAFLVVMPVLVRDVHGGSAGMLAVINFALWGGSVVSTLAQIRLPPFRRPGRAIMVSLTGGSLILAAMGLPISFTMLTILCAGWGIGAGITMTQSRTIAQLAAQDSHRARVLAIFQLGLSGGAPLGAVAIGFLAEHTSAAHATLYPALAMLTALTYLATRTKLWTQRPTERFGS